MNTSRSPLSVARLHPRNKHRDGYDFAALTQALPELAAAVKRNAYGNDSIDFADPLSVKLLNRALLKCYYAIDRWDIPPGFLCPPIPGRADYLHHAADLLSAPRGGHVLDIGTGANLIYPLLGQHEYDWHFVAVDIDERALDSARHIIDNNAELGGRIELRQQPDSGSIFAHIILADDNFVLTVCNPPFHASAAAASTAAQRKLQNLARHKGQQAPTKSQLNFGGQHNELFCTGGEAAFIHQMIRESAAYKTQVSWFTTLVSKADNSPSYQRALKKLSAAHCKTVPMRQGQKTSHMLAWSYQ